MPDLRKDPIVGRWVIVAKSRAKRPHDFNGSATLRTDSKFCPFCACDHLWHKEDSKFLAPKAALRPHIQQAS